MVIVPDQNLFLTRRNHGRCPLIGIKIFLLDKSTLHFENRELGLYRILLNLRLRQSFFDIRYSLSTIITDGLVTFRYPDLQPV